MLRYLLCAAGEITPSDVDLAAASGGMVLGFNLEPEESVLSHAKRLGGWLGGQGGRALSLDLLHCWWTARCS